MLSSIVYKTLFEVKFLHEYYLTTNRGRTIFDFDQQEDRLNFIRDKFNRNEPAINEAIEFQVPEFMRLVMQGHHMRLIPTYSGFKIAVEVKPQSQPDGTILYMPVIPIAPDFSQLIMVVAKGSILDSFTNARLVRSLPAIYYFSNDADVVPKTSLLLSSPVSDFSTSKIYEQGELASFGPNDIREFFTDSTGDQWRKINGSGYVNENDRLLVPRKFYYSFNISDAITEAEFALKDLAGNAVPLKDRNERSTLSFQVQSSQPMQKVLVDTTPVNNHPDILQSLPVTSEQNKIIYTLEVSGSNGFSQKHQLIFFDGSLNANWGLIHIKPTVSSTVFSALDQNGFLKTRKTATGILEGTPAFEIRLTSRLTYWRYINNEGKNLDLSPIASEFLSNNSGRLITKTPRPITRSLTLFKKESDGSFHYLPNPIPGEFIKVGNKQLFSDIFVPESDLFPVQP